MLGFLKDLFDDGWQQDKIDNSPEAVSKRLAYLRLTRDDDYFNLKKEHYYTDYRTEKLPRKIEYSIVGQSYFLMQFALDPYHYGLTDEDKLALIAEDSYSDSSSNADIAALSVSLKYKNRWNEDGNSDGQGVLIPAKTLTGDDMEPFLVPVEAAVAMTLSPKGREGVAREAMLRYFEQPSWRDPERGNFKYATRVWDGQSTPSYMLSISMHLDIRVNGYPVDKCNLTLTEQWQIQQMLLDRKERGEFISDGKEERQVVSDLIAGRYRDLGMLNNFNLGGKVSDFWKWYGSRELALKVARKQYAQAVEEEKKNGCSRDR